MRAVLQSTLGIGGGGTWQGQVLRRTSRGEGSLSGPEDSEDLKGQDAHPSGWTSLSQVSGACSPHQGLTLPRKPVKATPLVSFAVLLPCDQVLGLILNPSYRGRK